MGIVRLRLRGGAADILGDIGEVRLSTARKGELIDRIRQVVPFEHIIATGLDLDGYRLGSGTLIAHDLPDTFLASYFAERHHVTDPFAIRVRATKRMTWDEEAWDIDGHTEAAQRLHALQRHYGIKHRTMAPLWRADRLYGAVTIAGKRPLTEAERGYFAVLAEPLHAALSHHLLDEANARLGLSKGEIRCLDHASHGLTSDDIAKEIGYTVETVNSYFKSAARKLGAANRTQAVGEAIRRGLIF